MDHRDHPAPDRSSHPAARLTPPARFEWTRQPGTGPPASILGPLTRAAVIELGCGSGHNLAHLVTQYHITGTGVDHDPAKIDRARRLQAPARPLLHPGRRLPLPDRLQARIG
ncbi:MAG: class I SAM-dependent methyltransferase [Streptosporangiaceae bacterium]